MQIQKDEVKNKILAAAIDEFLVSRYENSSMRVIASNAGITVGNIYSYFNGKEDLFESIVLPTVVEIKELISMNISSNNRITKTSSLEITGQIINLFLSNRDEFLILMNSAKGSKYENIRSVIQEEIRERLSSDLFSQFSQKHENAILADTIALVLLDGIINIVLKSKNDRELMNRLISNFLLLIFNDIENRI